MREMFIEKGFSDFLAKPIDISKLDEMLGRWIPKEKRERGKEKLDSAPRDLDAQTIPGIDIQKGISMTGGTVELYRQVMDLFCKDAEERLPLLQTVPDSDSLPAFITHVHALKSASASIGAAEVSDKAAKLEAAGKAADVEFIQKNLSVFANTLAELVKGIRSWESEQEILNGETVYSTTPHSDEGSPLDNAAVTQLLRELAAALETKNAGEIDRILEDIMQQTLDTKTKKALDAISDNVLMTEFESAAEIVRSLLSELTANR
jgi:HPt (histidine-containing phosphotransfer) domain-containing protein